MVIGSVRNALTVLLGAVAFLLLLICLNIACLALTRATARSGEWAVLLRRVRRQDG
jgi:hypothetical protein